MIPLFTGIGAKSRRNAEPGFADRLTNAPPTRSENQLAAYLQFGASSGLYLNAGQWRYKAELTGADVKLYVGSGQALAKTGVGGGRLLRLASGQIIM